LSEIVDSSSPMHTGDVIVCETCNGVLSNKSVLSDLKHKGKVMGKLWDCEFCSTKVSVKKVVLFKLKLLYFYF
jgi:hypothetical protein